MRNFAKWTLGFICAVAFLTSSSGWGPNNRVCFNAPPCSDPFAITCAGQAPNCVGGCWVTGGYPCDRCHERLDSNCRLQSMDVNAGLWRFDCGGPGCGSCVGRAVRFTDFHVIGSDC